MAEVDHARVLRAHPQQPHVPAYFTNSIELSFGALILSLFFGSLAAYGFSRFRLPGGQVMLMAILSLLMLPRVVLIIPYFRLAHVVGLYDTVPGLIVANTAFLLPLSTWLIKAYLDSIPHELDEAAMIDGCTRLQTLWKVVAPLAVPGVVGVAAFIFIGAWNEYLLAVVLTETTHSQTLTVGMSSFFGEYVRDWNGIMALTTMSSLPLVSSSCSCSGGWSRDWEAARSSRRGRMRIGIAGISHEALTFSPIPQTMEDFRVLRGPDILGYAGLAEAARTLEFEPVPLLVASARCPSGVVRGADVPRAAGRDARPAPGRRARSTASA